MHKRGLCNHNGKENMFCAFVSALATFLPVHSNYKVTDD